MIYTIKSGKIVPLVSKSGKRYNVRTKQQKHDATLKMKKKNPFYDFYNSAHWRRLSEKIKRRDPLCRECLRKYKAGKIPLQKVNLTQSVDHIVKLKDDWSKRFDPNNLQGLCWSCHRAKDKMGFLKYH